MKETPIIFNTDNVKAILDGRKTQTRRIIKPQPKFIRCDHKERTPQAFWVDNEKWIKCPYGQVGDRLWVREKHKRVEYEIACQLYRKVIYFNSATDLPNQPWRPSIFMPRWASRITLEITGVRVERLQEITEEDAIAEGVSYNTTNEYARMRVLSRGQANEDTWPTPQEAFRKLWDSLNAKRGYGWNTNPWVWVIEFKELTS